MFVSLDDTVQRFLLSELVLLWAGLLFGGWIFNRYRSAERGRMPTWTRISSSAVLLVAAGTWAVATSRGSIIGPVALLLAVGMLASFIGDLALAGLLAEWLQIGTGKDPAAARLRIGLAAFALAHIAYIGAFIALADAIDRTSVTLSNAVHQAFLVSISAWLVVGIIGWLIFVARGTELQAMRLPGLIYALLIAGMAGCATALAVQTLYFLPVAIGAGLFVVSDLLVAGDTFGTLRLPIQTDLIWLTYGPAQVLIIYTSEFALRFLAK